MILESGREYELVKNLVNSYKTKSCVKFRIDSESGVFAMSSEPDVSDEDLQRWGEEKWGAMSHWDYVKTALQDTQNTQNKQKVLEELRRSYYASEIGGPAGITGRSLERMEEHLPSLIDELQKARGKVIFAGNGLSTAGIEYLEQHPDQDIQIWLVDLFDYNTLLEDLSGLVNILHSNKLNVPDEIQDALDKCQAIAKQLEDNPTKVRAATHFFGHSQPNPDLQNASLVINSFGPHWTETEELLGLLKQGGVCLSSDRLDQAPPRYSISRISDPNTGKQSTKLVKN